MAASMLPRPPQQAASRRRMVNSGLEPDEAAPAWQYPRAMLSAVLPQQQPFRDSTGQRSTTLVFRPDEEEESLLLYRIEEDDSGPYRKNLYIPVEESKRHDLPLQPAPGIGPWEEFDLMSLLLEQADSLDLSLEVCAGKFAVVEVLASEWGWYWHPWLGFAKAITTR